MKISIAMASYNGSRYLPEQLESLARQFRMPDELIVTDDCSHDGTADILLAFAAKAPFTMDVSVNPHNLGYAQNFGAAITRTTGDLVFLSDQDDVWLPEKLTRIEALAIENPEAICIMNDTFLADEVLTCDGRSKLVEMRARGLSDEEFVMGCCSAFRRPYLELALPIPAEMKAHDNWLVQLAELFGGVMRLGETLQYYRLHGANTSDFLVNSPLKLSWAGSQIERLARLRRRFSSGGNFHNEIAFAENVIQRLSERREEALTVFTPEKIDEVLAAQSRKLEILRERSRLRQLGWIKRLLAAYRLYRGGGYAQSGRLLGAIKDIVHGSRLVGSE